MDANDKKKKVLLSLCLLSTVQTLMGFLSFKLLVKDSYIFWDITPCSPVKVDRRFGGTYRYHPQDRRVSQTRN
jgi:hypothetical protein